ncbi:hypothetical protein QYF61_010980 [Mycteria americana]|uniref:Uncharacterized protein n=1 Tax=Mycteria americana TaxID=33587 RepID=A0AAN7S366_MYCAM|nr:hypothetical protein QYF61_010980 [Mycteria americana]
MASRLRELILPLYSALMRPHLECWIHLWGLQCNKDKDLLEWSQRTAIKMIGGLERLSYEKKARELVLFSLEKRRVQGHLIVVFQYLKRAYKKDGEGLFTKAYSMLIILLCCAWEHFDNSNGHASGLPYGQGIAVVSVLLYWARWNSNVSSSRRGCEL